MELKNGIYWAGALDYKIKVFDIVMHTDYGTTYNSYVVKGSEKTAIFETVKETFFDEYLERLKTITKLEDIDIIVINHTEPDHAGSVGRLLSLCPNATVIGSQTSLKFASEIINQEFKSIVAKDGDTFSLGDKTLEFISVPFLHWPDSMYTYIKEDKALFTCDSFGCHFCDEKITNKAINREFIDAYKYYFDCIMGPFKPYVLKAIDRLEALGLDNIELICPGHGPVLVEEIPKYIQLYKEWSQPLPLKKEVVIPYVTAYGYTKKLAEEIKKGLEAANVQAHLYDLVDADKNEVVEKINECKGLLVGSPTLIGDALPPIMEILVGLNPIIHQGRLAGAFGSYGWSGEAVGNIEARLKQLKFKMPLPGLKICFNPSKQQLAEAFEFGKKFGEALA